MATPNPLEPVKGAGTTLWVYNGKGDAYANPLSDDDWQRLAKVKDLTPGEMTAEPYDDNYLDDEDADWTATGQGQKSAGDTSFTLAWKPGEEGQTATGQGQKSAGDTSFTLAWKPGEEGQ
ncbi:phage tail tube protein, partial [Escherichia coli]|uniref:phage tail tube protein n=1 Tax=Escherichia coli TaxID=562 RepID=UPI0010CAEC71